MRDKYGPGGWCVCKKCRKYIKHSFVPPCNSVKCVICGRRLEKVKDEDK